MKATRAVYDFFWNDFCRNWYLEAAKEGMYSREEEAKNRQISLLLDLLERSIRVDASYAPSSPRIYSKLPNKKGLLINHPYPEYDEALVFLESIRSLPASRKRSPRSRQCGVNCRSLDRKVQVAIQSDDSFIPKLPRSSKLMSDCWPSSPMR